MKFIRFHSASKSYLARNKLFISQSIQTCLLMGVGDVIAQTMVEKKKISRLDFQRTFKFAFVGLIFVGPALTTWYKFLSKTGSSKLLSTSTFKKVALDQLIFAPLFLPACITAINIINGKSLNENRNELKLKYMDVLLMNYRIWPTVQLLNFGLMPLKYQVLVNQAVAIFWNAYLSFKVQTNNIPRKKLS